MNIELGLRALILSDPYAEAKLRNRVFPGVAPQNAASPHACYHALGQDEGFTLSGPDGIPKWRGQIDVWSTNSDEARDIAEWIKLRLNGFRGWSGPVRMEKVVAEHGGHDSEPEDGADDTYWHRRMIDVRIDFRENFSPYRSET